MSAGQLELDDGSKVGANFKGYPAIDDDNIFAQADVIAHDTFTEALKI